MGGNVLVGANYDDTGATDAGAAYLFDGTTGALLRTFVNPTPEDSDHFGSSLAAVGNNVLVSAPGDDAAGTDAGAVYLFDGSTGELLHTFLHPTPEAGDEFGDCVRALGNKVFVSAPKDDAAGTDAGAVYLFDSPSGELLKTFLNPTPEAGDAFGGWRATAALGSKVVIGARLDDTLATDTGTVYVFEGPIPEPLLTIPNPTPEVGDNFGCVAAVGDNILVGVYNDDTAAEDAGAAYLFDGTTAELLRTFADPTPGEFDRFGRVAALGNNVLVSATRDDIVGTDAGAVYLFDSTTGDLLRDVCQPHASRHRRVRC